MALISCPECGEKLSDKASKCPHCGYSVGREQPAQQLKKSKAPFIIAGIFAAIAAVLAAFILPAVTNAGGSGEGSIVQGSTITSDIAVKDVSNVEYTLETDGTTGIYSGKWKNGKPDGYGEMKYDSGVVYKGDWSGGVQSGQGTLTSPNGYVYNGEWADGKQNGKGNELFENGDRYEGKLLDGLKSGQGTYKFSYGYVYEGNWKDNVPSGYGKLTSESGEVLFEGTWNGWETYFN